MLTLTAASTALGEQSDQVLYRKQVSPQQSVVAVRHQIVYVAPAKSLPSGFQYIKPDRIYQYDFILIGPNNQKKKIWSHNFQSFAPNSFLPNDYQILDCAIQGKTFIIVCKESNKTWGGPTFANVVNSSNTARNDRKELSRKEALLTHDSDVGQIFISSATITGSIQGNNLTVNLKNVSSSLVFSWKDDHWQHVTETTPDPSKKQRNQ